MRLEDQELRSKINEKLVSVVLTLLVLKDEALAVQLRDVVQRAEALADHAEAELWRGVSKRLELVLSVASADGGREFESLTNLH